MSDAERLAGAKERAWRELADIDAALDAGELDEAGWHRAVLDIVEPAYLQAGSPQGGSGSSRDAAGWERARSLILDACDRPGDLLDVGCANGLLMESLADWSGGRLEPYGVEISPLLAQLARERCPQWQGRIWAANAHGWDPGRRFDYVRAGLDYVPERSRAAYVDHLLTLIRPGGRLIVGVHNEERDLAVVEEWLTGLGLTVAGRSERAHDHPRLRYKVCWVDRG